MIIIISAKRSRLIKMLKLRKQSQSFAMFNVSCHDVIYDMIYDRDSMNRKDRIMCQLP